MERVKREGYRPATHAAGNAELRDALDLVAGGHFSRGDRDTFRPLVENLLQSDPFLALADYADYIATQARVDALYLSPAEWQRKAILNVAGMGPFSADRTIADYANDTWKIHTL